MEPTFHAVIDEHPDAIPDVHSAKSPIDLTDDYTIPEGALPVTRQNATIQPGTPPNQEITKRVPSRPIKPDPDAAGVHTGSACEFPKHAADPMPPLYAQSNDVEVVLYALGASFAVGALVGTLLSFAFSRQEVSE